LSTAKRQKHRQTTKEVKERKATKEAIRAAKEKLSSTGLFEEAFDLADSLARNADSYSNRLESSLYGGSNRSVGVQNSSKHALVRGAVSVDTLWQVRMPTGSLTFPCVHKDRDDAVEAPLEGNGDSRSKWEAASKARAVGVVAMEQLLSRLKKTSSERDLLDANCSKLQAALTKLQDEHSVLLEKQAG